MLMSVFGDRVRKALAADSKLSSAGLARACGIKPPSVSNWLTGKNKSARGQTLIRAADYLGVRAEWLATGRPPMRESDVTNFDREHAQPAAASQPAGLDVATLTSVIETVESAVAVARIRPLPPALKARVIAALYSQRAEGAVDPADLVQMTLAAILKAIQEQEEEPT
jgi:transcriptional regulator with XRE-family HTH domain